MTRRYRISKNHEDMRVQMVTQNKKESQESKYVSRRKDHAVDMSIPEWRGETRFHLSALQRIDFQYMNSSHDSNSSSLEITEPVSIGLLSGEILSDSKSVRASELTTLQGFFLYIQTTFRFSICCSF